MNYLANVNVIDLVFDPGHGGSDPGAVGPTTKEKDNVLVLAKETAAILEATGRFRVKFTRDTDKDFCAPAPYNENLDLKNRVDIANSLGGKVFVAFHDNSAASKAYGNEVYAATPGAEGEKLAKAVLASLRSERPDLDDMPVVLASTPDYIGSMQEGYQRTVEALITTLAGHQIKTFEPFLFEETPSIALLPGCHLTPGDVDELKEIVSEFGFRPITVPDLSISLDGHAELEAAPVVQGGTLLADFQRLPQCSACLSFGLSMEKAGEILKKTYEIPHFNFPSLTGLKATDTFILSLAKISGKPIPEKILRQRSRLLDTLADYHDQLGGQKIAIALEMDLLYSLASCLVEVGSEISVALAASQGGIHKLSLPIPIEVGDLEELEERAVHSHLIIANSNGRQAAGLLKIPHLRAGLPVFDRVGYPQKRWIGYEGTQQFLFDMLNSLS